MGYPNLNPQFDIDGPKTLIVYEDVGGSRKLGKMTNEKVGVVWGLSYFIVPGAEEEADAIAHFGRVQKALVGFGRDIKLWITREPRLVHDGL